MSLTAEHTEQIIDGQYKDNSPAKTVAKIKSILTQHGLKPQEHWFDSGVPYCYSNKINIPGTTFRSIGKGLSKELALASAYGELIERLQLGLIYGPTSLKDGDYTLESSEHEMRPASTLLTQDRGLYEALAQMHFDRLGIPTTPERILSPYTTSDGMVRVTPYLDLTTKQTAYLSTVLRKRLYGTNGCAAGNTPEEALVQAISEIIERNHQVRVVSEGMGLPDIPEDILKTFKVSYQIIQFVREHGCKVIIKDASLGTGYPVICACVIDCETGRYHTHFGSHPVLEIAVERSLTESFQWRSIRSIATNEDFSPKSDGKFSINAFYSELRQSTGNKPTEFFVGEARYPFDPNMGIHTCDNRQMLRYCVDFFKKAGHSLLVRDCSCLGFPTYQVVSPGYSEMYINRICEKYDDQYYAPYAIATLRDPAKATVPQMLGTLLHLDRLKMLDSGLQTVHKFTMITKIPSQISSRYQKYLMAASLGYIYISLGKYRDAAAQVGAMISGGSEKDLQYLICLKRYLSMVAEGYPPSQIKELLLCLHQPELVQELLTQFSEKKNPMERFVLHCDKQSCDTCIVRDDCYLKRVDALADILDEKQNQIDVQASADYLRSIV